MTTRAVEDYLKTIYKLQQGGSRASTNAIAEKMGVRAASVTSMLQQLSEQGLVDYAPYRGAYLTTLGLATGLRVIRRHRLIELYLHQHLSVPWDRVHEEAERLEHAISPYLEERIDNLLGYPGFDPHGAPIPTDAGEIAAEDVIPLSELPLNMPSVVGHIPDEDSALLRDAASLDLLPGATVTVTRRQSSDGALSVVVTPAHATSERTHEVGAELACRVLVNRPELN
ncbi:MAG: DtxR family transcriptional regulator, Mn-dependent transcriptional regulator [Chloroflexia bacterium]|nr:DtxR family transcriptional regulator, Mn-dependent transcriptional regulator [Chloroflexia bacterium]